MQKFDHEKLDVYKVSIELITLIDAVVITFPKGKAYLTDQLQRACTSISLNIAEGAGEFSSNEKCRFYRMAKRSATECAAIFDVCLHIKIISEEHYSKTKDLLMRIVSMLIKLVHSFA